MFAQSVPALKELCAQAGLPQTGKKQDLVDRLGRANKRVIRDTSHDCLCFHGMAVVATHHRRWKVMALVLVFLAVVGGEIVAASYSLLGAEQSCVYIPFEEKHHNPTAFKFAKAEQWTRRGCCADAAACAKWNAVCTPAATQCSEVSSKIAQGCLLMGLSLLGIVVCWNCIRPWTCGGEVDELVSGPDDGATKGACFCCFKPAPEVPPSPRRNEAQEKQKAYIEMMQPEWESDPTTEYVEPLNSRGVNGRRKHEVFTIVIGGTRSIVPGPSLEPRVLTLTKSDGRAVSVEFPPVARKHTGKTVTVKVNGPILSAEDMFVDDDGGEEDEDGDDL